MRVKLQTCQKVSMADSLEQRCAIKFCFKLGKTAVETYKMLQQAYGEDCLSRGRVFEWFGRFKEGRESVQDDSRSGRPVSARNDNQIELVREKINSDRRLTIREVSLALNISYGTVQKILTQDLGMSRVCAKFVPRLLTDEQKERRLSTSREMLETIAEVPGFLDRVITGDESWIYSYDPETKSQSSQWKSPTSPRPKKARMSRSATKAMLVVFFDLQGIVHKEWIPQGQTVTKEVYLGVLKGLRLSIRRKRPERWKRQDFILHHDNAPAHTAIKVTEYLAKNSTAVAPHPPYSPDLAPNDFFLFPRLKSTLKGQRFDTLEAVKQATTTELDSIPKSEFQRCMESWKTRLQQCIDRKGEYFEGDSK